MVRWSVISVSVVVVWDVVVVVGVVVVGGGGGGGGEVDILDFELKVYLCV